MVVMIVIAVMMMILVDNHFTARVTRVTDRGVATRQRGQQGQTHQVAIETSHGYRLRALTIAIGAPPVAAPQIRCEIGVFSGYPARSGTDGCGR